AQVFADLLLPIFGGFGVAIHGVLKPTDVALVIDDGDAEVVHVFVIGAEAVLFGDVFDAAEAELAGHVAADFVFGAVEEPPAGIIGDGEAFGELGEHRGCVLAVEGEGEELNLRVVG
ncbi:MAG: hypothetical protein ACK56I_21575, partial [bacterium]